VVVPALILCHRDQKGRVHSIPFCYEDGQALTLVEDVANYLYANNLIEPWENGLAADRLQVILENRARIVMLGEVIEQQQRIICKLQPEVFA